MTKEREELLRKREKRASMAISVILVLLGISVVSSAADDLAGGAEDSTNLTIVMAIAFISVPIFAAMTTVKFHYANKLNSASLRKDGLCSMIGTILAIGLFVTTVVIEKAPAVWWLDPAFAMTCGFIALIIGLQAIIVASCVQKIPIFSLRWWLVSQGDGMDEVAGRELEPSDFGEKVNQDVEMAGSERKMEDTKLSEVV